jgi:hypothetical protein
VIAVLAGPRDLPARRFVQRWRAQGARLITLADLSHAGWCHHVGDSGPERAVSSLESIPTGALHGVLNRIPGIAAADLPHVAEPDREYVAAEMGAFLLAWLTRLPCPVVNQPAPNALMGGAHAPEGWAALAAREGLRLSWTRQSYPRPVAPWPAEAALVTVLGKRTFGDVAPALAEQARRLAARAGVELLAVGFDDTGPDAAFVGAHLWPDVSQPDLAEALLKRFEAPA